MGNIAKQTRNLIIVLILGLACIGNAQVEIPRGVVLWFSFDALRDNNTKLPNMSDSNHFGRVNGVRLTPAGRLTSGGDFNGKHSFIQVPSIASLENAKITACLWFKTANANTPDRFLLDKTAENSYSLRLVTGTTTNPKRGYLYAKMGGNACLSDTALADNIWHHACITYDGTTLVLYVDSVPQKQPMTKQSDLSVKGGDLFVGIDSASATSRQKVNSFEGTMDEILLFNRVLSPTEVKNILIATRPVFNKGQVQRQIQNIQGLYERGLLTKTFYERILKEYKNSEQ